MTVNESKELEKKVHEFSEKALNSHSTYVRFFDKIEGFKSIDEKNEKNENCFLLPNVDYEYRGGYKYKFAVNDEQYNGNRYENLKYNDDGIFSADEVDPDMPENYITYYISFYNETDKTYYDVEASIFFKSKNTIIQN